MEINHSEYTISELVERFDKDIRVNRDYQRGGGLWPDSAKVYFIDTILEQYPFQKLYFHQIYDKAKKKPIMEVVDGQQRILTIIDFMNDELRLTGASQNFKGLTFSQLPEDMQERLRMSRIQVDVILSAEKTKLLEMFRRMNAYTAPLNPAEKRHAKYQGKFKWFAVEMADRITPALEQFGILSPKQMLRMAEVEFIAELAIVVDSGIIHKSSKSIEDIYKKYDKQFPIEEKVSMVISSFFETLVNNFGTLRNSHLMKTYAIHSFFCAYAQIRYGIPNGEETVGVKTRNMNIKTDKQTMARLQALSDAHEVKDETGEFREYVAATSTTTKEAQRKARSRVIAQIICP
jgi:Protein of unknown function DUF262